MFNPMELTDKVFLVTGASSGIGRATAVLLSQLGARVVLSGRREGALSTTRAAMERPECHWIEPYDLADLASIPTWLKAVTQRNGIELSGLVHSAGVSKIVPIRAMSVDNIESVIGPNLEAALMLLKGCTAKGVSTDGASLIFISSVMGFAGSPGLTAYAASKGALSALVQTAARELSGRKVRVNCVAPGMVETPMHDDHADVGSIAFQASVNRHALGLGKPEDVANAVAFMLSPAARWITGTTFIVDGGYLS